MTFSFRQSKGVIYNNRLNQEYDLDKPKEVSQLCYEMNNLERINADFYMKLQDEKKKINELYDENLKLRWILRHYNPQDLNLSFDDEKFKEQIELLYSEKEFLDD